MRRTISVRGFAVSAAVLGAMVAFGATIQAQSATSTPDPTIEAVSTLQAQTLTPDPTLQAISTSMVSGTAESTITPAAMGTETVTATEVSGGTATPDVTGTTTPDATSTAVDAGTGTPITTAMPTSDSTATPLATATSSGTTTATPLATTTSIAVSTPTPTAASTTTTTVTAVPTSTVTATAVPGSANRTITVDGVGQANAVPDQAVVVLGVQTTAVTASVALSENNAIVRDLINVLTAGGVLSDDIQTQNLSLYAITNQPQGTTDIPRLVGFNVNNNVMVRIRNLSNLGTLLDQAVTAGANNIQSIQFELSNPEAQLQQARVEAINNARTKAQQLADLASGSLGAIISISESSSGFPVPLAAREGMGGAAVPIEPGRQSVQIIVQVTWALQ